VRTQGLFSSHFFPRFTKWAQLLALLIVILAAIDVVLVLRDLWRSGTRLRAVGAIVLWLPLFFLISMVDVWEGPSPPQPAGSRHIVKYVELLPSVVQKFTARAG
jgi:hypothetical protein